MHRELQLQLASLEQQLDVVEAEKIAICQSDAAAASVLQGEVQRLLEEGAQAGAANLAHVDALKSALTRQGEAFAALRQRAKEQRATLVRVRLELDELRASYKVKKSTLVQQLRVKEVERASILARAAALQAEKDSVHVHDLARHVALEGAIRDLTKRGEQTEIAIASIRAADDEERIKLNAEITRLAAEDATLMHETEDLRSHVNRLNAAVGFLHARLDESEARERDLAGRLAQETAVRERIEADASSRQIAAARELKEHEVAELDMKERLVALQNEVDATHTSEVETHRDLEAQMAAIQAKLESAAEAKAAIASRSAAEARALHAEIDALLKTNAQLVDEEDDLKDDQLAARAKMKKLAEKLAEVQALHCGATSRCTDLEAQLAAAQAASESLTEALATEHSEHARDVRTNEVRQAELQQQMSTVAEQKSATHASDVETQRALQTHLEALEAQLKETKLAKQTLEYNDAARLHESDRQVAALLAEEEGLVAAAAHDRAASEHLTSKLRGAITTLQTIGREQKQRAVDAEKHFASERRQVVTLQKALASARGTAAIERTLLHQKLHDEQAAEAELEHRLQEVKKAQVATHKSELREHERLRVEQLELEAKLDASARDSSTREAQRELEREALEVSLFYVPLHCMRILLTI